MSLKRLVRLLGSSPASCLPVSWRRSVRICFLPVRPHATLVFASVCTPVCPTPVYYFSTHPHSVPAAVGLSNVLRLRQAMLRERAYKSWPVRGILFSFSSF
jgi:hypothetical protein